MSKVFVTPMGGGSGGGLEKLWEGDVHLTGSTDDLTGGAVDPSECILLIVHCTGTVTPQETLKFGVGSCNGTSSSYKYDISLGKKTSGEAQPLTITMAYRKCGGGDGIWYGEHLRAISDKYSFYTEIPFSFKACTDSTAIKNTFTGDLHVAAYGLKL